MTGSRLPALFLVAVLGVLACLGLVLHAVAGVVVSVPYAVLVLVLLAVGARRARAAQVRARLAAGRSCTCCTTSQHDPVRVV